MRYNSAKNFYNNYPKKVNENIMLIKGKKDIYSIKETIGKGTFGKVKLAYSKKSNKKYACKILEKLNIKEKDDKKRCQREMSILLQMNNKNVIKTSEIISDSSRFYIIMEYCPKGELFNHIVEQQHFNEENSAYYYYQLISGVDYIHSKNICHRDLKPENLLLNEDNELKIIDFGLSNFYFGEEKLLRTPCGSPCYASPEMILGKDYDGYCIDIWSSGIILYAMLCGYLPFEEGDETTHNSLLFKNIVECKVEYPEEFISPIAKDLLQKIIVREPKNRITIKQIKKHPFFLLGKEIYDKKFSSARNNNTIDYTYESHRIYPSINYNNKNFGGKYKHKFINNINNNHHKLEEIKINMSDIYLNENNENKEYNNYNDKYIKTNYERNNCKNIIGNNDILNSELLNTSSNNINNKNQITDINDIYFNTKEGNFINKKNNHSVKNRFNSNINNSLNENSKNGNYIHNKNYYLNNMTLETKLNKNRKNILEDEIKVKQYIKLNNELNIKFPNYQKFDVYVPKKRESIIYNNYIETNYDRSNIINNYNSEINQKYMKTDTFFNQNKIKNYRGENYKKYEDSMKYLNTNINTNNYYKCKRKQILKNTFRNDKYNNPQISLYKGLIYNNQKQTSLKNPKNNNPSKNKYSVEYKSNKIRCYNNSDSNNDINFNNNKLQKNKSNKSNDNNNNRTNTYSNYIQNIYFKKDNISNVEANINSLSPKNIQNPQFKRNIIIENEKDTININNHNPYSFNSIKQRLKSYNNINKSKNYNKNCNNKVINTQNNIYHKNRSSRINYNLTLNNIENKKIKSNKNSHININEGKNFINIRPKSQKGTYMNNSKNNYYNNKRLAYNNILYTDTYMNTFNNGKNKRQELCNKNNETNKKDINENKNKIIINLNILKPKIFVENNKNNLRRNKYSPSLVKTYNNININTKSRKSKLRNEIKKNVDNAFNNINNKFN